MTRPTVDEIAAAAGITIEPEIKAMQDADRSTCPICGRAWKVWLGDDCLLPLCGCFGHDASEANPNRPCEACGTAHAVSCHKMPPEEAL